MDYFYKICIFFLLLINSLSSSAQWNTHHHFTSQTDSFPNIYSILFTNDSTGFAVGAKSTGAGVSKGVIISTVDGGNTWVDVVLKDSTTFSEVVSLNDSILFVIGNKIFPNSTHQGFIMQSNNWGLSWNTQHLSFSPSDIETLSDSIIIVIGADNFQTNQPKKIHQSNNKGLSWSTSPFNLFNGSKLKFLKDSIGFFFNGSNQLFRVLNQGGQLSQLDTVTIDTSNNIHIIKVYTANTSKVFALVRDGSQWNRFVYESLDGGVS